MVRTFLVNNFIGLIALILFLLFAFTGTFKGCGNNSNKGTDTVRVETRTEYIPQPIVINPTYTPSATSVRPTIVIPPQYQPSGDNAELLKQYKNLVDSFLAVKKYEEKIHLKDSSGNDVGTVNVNASVTKNSIDSFGSNYQLRIPHTYTTITIKDPPRRQLYADVSTLSTTHAPFVNGGTLGLTYKDKRNNMYGIGAGALKLPNYPTTSLIQLKYSKLIKVK